LEVVLTNVVGCWRGQNKNGVKHRSKLSEGIGKRLIEFCSWGVGKHKKRDTVHIILVKETEIGKDYFRPV